MDAMKSWLRARAGERNSIQVYVTLLLGAGGIAVAPAQADLIAGGVVALLAAIGFASPQK